MTGPAPSAVQTFRPLLKPAITGVIFSVIATAWCALAAGQGLSLFFGAVLLSAFYVPALTLAETPEVRWIPPLSIGAGIILCWTVSLHIADVTVGELFRCSLICLVFTFALAGLASLLARIRLAPPAAAFTVTLIALLWLTWPVWLSHGLTQARVDALTYAHPLLAINGVLRHLGAWDRATLAYQRLTILNQDIPYSLPHTILPALLVHSLIGVACFTPTFLLRWIRSGNEE